jgi:hypothetical protein
MLSKVNQNTCRTWDRARVLPTRYAYQCQLNHCVKSPRQVIATLENAVLLSGCIVQLCHKHARCWPAWSARDCILAHCSWFHETDGTAHAVEQLLAPLEIVLHITTNLRAHEHRYLSVRTQGAFARAWAHRMHHAPHMQSYGHHKYLMLRKDMVHSAPPPGELHTPASLRVASCAHSDKCFVS